jgi:hypothetical protein
MVLKKKKNCVLQIEIDLRFKQISLFYLVKSFGKRFRNKKRTRRYVVVDFLFANLQIFNLGWMDYE